jgi:hypothetical protein
VFNPTRGCAKPPFFDSDIWQGIRWEEQGIRWEDRVDQPQRDQPEGHAAEEMIVPIAIFNG